MKVPMKVSVVWLLLAVLIACQKPQVKPGMSRDDMKRLGVKVSAQVTATPLEGPAPLTVQFQLTAPTAVVNAWDFGDGSTGASNEINPVHTYTQAGQFEALVAVADQNGQGSYAMVTITANKTEDTSNPYCGPNGQWTGPKTDGPAQAPLKCLYTPLSATPATNPPKTLGAQDNLQVVLKSAVCGDVIKIDPQNVYDGTLAGLKAPTVKCDDQHWIIVESAAIDRLPGEMQRITPAYAGVASLPGRPAFDSPVGGAKRLMPQVLLKNSLTGCDHVRWIGIEFTRKDGVGQVVNMVNPGQGATQCVFDRNWFHGNATEETRRAVFLGDATSVAFINNYFSDFHCLAKTGSCTDSQAVSGGGNTGPVGPYKLVNNFLEAGAEAVLFGGSYGAVEPTDIQVMYNDFYKPMTWNKASPTYGGKEWIVKNHFELKVGRRVWFEGNRLQNVWGGYSQTGAAILITPKSQGGNPLSNYAKVEDVVIRLNYISFAGQTVQEGCVTTSTTPPNWPVGCRAWVVENNLFDNMSYGTACFGCGKTMSQLASGYIAATPPPVTLSDVIHDHNTIVNTTWVGAGGQYVGIMLGIGGPPSPNSTQTPQMKNVKWTNNIEATGWGGLYSVGGGASNCATVVQPADKIAKCWTGDSAFTGNVFMNAGYGGGQQYPTGNFFAPDWAGVGFVDFAGGKYALSPNSPFSKKGTDGKDPGADIAAVMAAVAKRRP